MHRVVEHVVDFIWPRVWGQQEGEDERQLRDLEVRSIVASVGAQPSDESIKELRSVLQYTYGIELQRRASLDGRLGVMAGLTAAAGTVSIGMLGGSVGIAGWIKLYILVQFCVASLNAVRGLQSKAHSSLVARDLVQRSGDGRAQYAERLGGAYLKSQYSIACVNNEKTDCMSCAQRAIKNALWAMLVLGAGAVIDSWGLVSIGLTR